MGDLFEKIHDKLPVFKIIYGQFIILYTPGYYVTLPKLPAKEVNSMVQNPESIIDLNTRNAITTLLGKSRDAVRNRENREQSPFTTECLTIHSGSECNLNCSYCYSKVKDTGNARITGFPDSKAIETIIQYIIDQDKKRKVLTIAYHGSGEPTFHWQQLTNAYARITHIASQHNLTLFHYIATNGCLTEEQADWLSDHIDLIGISCDGPPSIQEKQRNGNKSHYLSIDKICARILEKGGHFDIRTTITPGTISKQLEIVRYLIDDCKAKTIRIEPAYLAGENSFNEAQADIFADNFIRAQQYAHEKDVAVSYAGVRINEIHSSYCEILRNTLRLTPDGNTRNCFAFLKNEPEFITGRYDTLSSSYIINPSLQSIKTKASQIPDECWNCINVLHCSRGCPDFCVYENSTHGTGALNPFRCRLHQILTVEYLKNLVKTRI